MLTAAIRVSGASGGNFDRSAGPVDRIRKAVLLSIGG